jgi:hypothetical protein
MASLTTYAELLTDDSLAVQSFKAGIRKNQPGMLLADVLRVSSGAYEARIDFPPPIRDEIKHIAKVTANAELASIADRGSVIVSLEQFRGADPATTRITFGYRLDVQPGESAKLGLDHQGPYDPSKTIRASG